MTTPDGNHTDAARVLGASSEYADPCDGPVSTLRGAGVDINARVVGRVAMGVFLGTLAVLIVVFSVAGIQKNAQITRLRTHGIRVEVTVSGCLGLLGGSGSNGAGYACRGTFALAGHRYNVAIPGNTLYRPGTTIPMVSTPGDPTLVATVGTVATERASGRVFVLPALLLALLLVLVGGIVLRGRRGGAAAPSRAELGEPPATGGPRGPEKGGR